MKQKDVYILILSIILCVIAIITSFAADAKPLVVAVVDTGLDIGYDYIPLCLDNGLVDMTGTHTIADIDTNNHGSNVAGLIAQNAGHEGYCLVIIKVFSIKMIGNTPTLNLRQKDYEAALKYIINLKPFIANFSMAGYAKFNNETYLTKKILDQGTLIVAAAGNDHKYLSKVNCTAYPACIDKRIIVVGNKNNATTNRGPRVDLYIDGNNKKAGGHMLSGSSQSAAICTGKLIKQALKEGIK